MGAWSDFMISVIIMGFLLAIALLFLKPEEVAKQVEPKEMAKQEVAKNGKHKKHK